MNPNTLWKRQTFVNKLPSILLNDLTEQQALYDNEVVVSSVLQDVKKELCIHHHHLCDLLIYQTENLLGEESTYGDEKKISSVLTIM